MGIRIHAAKVYNVQWSTNSGFNNSREEVAMLLGKAGVNIYTIDNEEPLYSPQWEIDKEELDNYVNSLPKDDYTRIQFEYVLQDATTNGYGDYVLLWF